MSTEPDDALRAEVEQHLDTAYQALVAVRRAMDRWPHQMTERGTAWPLHGDVHDKVRRLAFEVVEVRRAIQPLTAEELKALYGEGDD